MKVKPGEMQTRSIEGVALNEDAGIFEGYIVVWNTVDSYRSTFTRGAFVDTIQKRGDRVKVIDDHNVLIGKSLSIIEDDHGVKVTGKINIETTRGADVFKLMKDGTYDGLSFGFTCPPGSIEKRGELEVINKVMLYEYGPVIFPANDNAIIMDMRSTDFNETLDDNTKQYLGWTILDSLQQTLLDIRWSKDIGKPELLALLDKAIGDFHATFMTWAADFYLETVPPGKDIYTYLANIGTDDTIVSESPLTRNDLILIRKGVPIDGSKLQQYPELYEYNRSLRSSNIEQLFIHLRAGLKPAEVARVRALLAPQENENDSIERQLRTFRETLKQA
jgi:HK97 family phage prohead protease